MVTTLLVLAMVACIAAMVGEQLRQHRRRRREHDALLDDVTALEHPVRGHDAAGLPVLSGRHDGHDARLDLVIDSLALRKLPRLFLRGAVHRPLPAPAPIFAVRLTAGSGMAENDRRLDHDLPTPAGWPDDVLVRTTSDGPAEVPPHLRRLGELFDDERTASVLASPRGLRLTWEVARGQVAAWRVSRGARFGEPVPAAVSRELLETAAGVAAELAGADRHPRAAARS